MQDYRNKDYQPLMYHILQKYHLYDRRKDYIDICYIGFAKALNKYDKSRTKFSTYAYKCIENELLCYLRKENATKRQRDECSLESVYSDQVYFDYLKSEDTNISKKLIKQEEENKLHVAIKTLNAKEQDIIKMLFGIECEEQTQNQVAKAFEISQSQVSLIKTKALTKLKEILENEDE